MNIWRREMGKQDSSWRRVFIVLVSVCVICDSVSGKQMSETLQRALSAVRGPSPGAKKLLNIPEDGDTEQLQTLTSGDGLQLAMSDSHSTIVTYGKETYDLIERAIVEIKNEEEDEEEDDVTRRDSERNIKKAQKYTGLHAHVLLELLKNPITVTKLVEIDRKYIHYELMKFNLEKNIMPNTTDLFHSLQYCLPPYLDIRSFRNELVRLGYIFKKANSQTAVVIENPAVRFERFIYLKKIKQYREEKMPIYFICEGSLTYDKVLNIDEHERESSNKWHHRFICIVSSTGVKSLKSVTEEFNFESYILDTTVELEDNSVIVLDNSKQRCQKLCETPNVNSLKCELIEWLEYHQVPCKPTMKKIELWSLIEMYTDTNANMNRLDSWLKTQRFEVIRIPNSLNNLTPEATLLDIFHKNIDRNCNSEDMIKKLEVVTEAITEKDLEIINSAIITQETRLLELDLMLDDKFDDLLPSTTPEIDTYLPTFINTEQ